MIDREKVINGLECCATNRLRREDCEAMNCAYLDLEGNGCIHQLIRDAIALLKAQEPRVMTLEEIPYAVFGWMEMFGQIIPCVLEDVYADDTVGFANIEDGHDYMCASDYGKTWRVWTSRPTVAEMEATPWPLAESVEK